MSLPGDTAVEQMNVCQTCGDKGDMKKLVYCVKCQVSAEHRYCMAMLPRKADKNVIWTCEECSPRDAKTSPVPSRRSERISEVAESRLNRMKMRKEISFSKVNAQACKDGLTKARQLICDNSCPQVEIKTESSSQGLGNEKLRKPRRRLVIEDGGNSDEKSEFVECSIVNPSQSALAICGHQLDKSRSLPSSESDGYVHAQPIIYPIWKGCFSIQNVENQTSIGLLAHVSTKACSKVWDAASALPLQLNVEILSKSDASTQNFQRTPPTDESIALYFFPENERDEKVFDSMIDKMIHHDHALKAMLNNLELLVFSSRELPEEHWRFRRKYYLWGVFKSTNPLVQGSNAEIALPSMPASNVGNQVGSELGKTDHLSPISPLSRFNGKTLDTKGSPLNEEL